MECPGIYCGRTNTDEGLSECGACPVGTRVNASGICDDCMKPLELYDWMYLITMALIPLIISCVSIDISIKKNNYFHCLWHLSAFIETSLSFVLSCLLFHPMGSLNIMSCGSKGLSDWYTIFFNPVPDFINTLICTQEAVHPLYSMVFSIFFFNMIFMLLSRCIIFYKHPSFCSIYTSLFFYPIIAFVHAVLAGFIYYSFPFIIILASISGYSFHFVLFESQTSKGLAKELFSSVRNVIILMVNTFCLTFSLVCLLQCQPFYEEFAIFSIIPLPPIVYILTFPLTKPEYLLTRFRKI